MNAEDDGSIPVTEACALHGVTLRQVDHWIRRGYLHVPLRGFGNPRRIDADELAVLAVLARLVRCGFRWEQAAVIAREVGDLGLEEFRLPGGIALTILEDEGAQ